MSYDITLEINTGKEMTEVAGLRSTITSNYSKVLKALFNVDSFYEMSHFEADMLIPSLERAIESLEKNVNEGWDTFIPYHKGCSRKDLLEKLSELLELCRNHPKCTVFIR